MKKFVALLLVLCMVLALGTVAFASGEAESVWQDTEEANAIRERNRASVKLYFEVEEFSPEQDALLAPNFQMEQPFWGLEGAEEDSSASREMPAGMEMPDWTPEWHWNDDLVIWGTDDPNFFFAYNTGYGLQLNDKNELSEYHNTYFHTFHFDENGQIDYYQEIGNPLNLMVAMGKEVDFPQPSDTLNALIDLYLEEHPEAANNNASGEAGGDTSEEAYHAYLKEYVDAVPAVTDEQFLEFAALIDASDYETMPADMMFNPQWWGYAAMTYDEFVAAGGVYEIPAFDPGLVAD